MNSLILLAAMPVCVVTDASVSVSFVDGTHYHNHYYAAQLLPNDAGDQAINPYQGNVHRTDQKKQEKIPKSDPECYIPIHKPGERCFNITKKINSVSDMKDALQNAIQVEYATIPPYLTAYFSLKNETGAPEVKRAQSLLSQVYRQEMLHMVLACNLLLSIGGQVNIEIPKFPAQLPCELGHDPKDPKQPLTVSLSPLSNDSVQIFKHIEKPDLSKTQCENSLGGFYRTIQEGFNNADIEWPEFDTKLQKFNKVWRDHLAITEDGPKDKNNAPTTIIDSLDNAKRAVIEIIDQGEGASPGSHDSTEQCIEGPNNKTTKSHYCLFLQLERLIPTLEEKNLIAQWSNTDYQNKYLIDSDEYHLAKDFDEKYTEMINTLNNSFKKPSKPDPVTKHDEITTAILQMYNLTRFAKDFRKLNIQPGWNSAI